VPAVRDLTARYENFMLTPLRGPGVCDVCFNLTEGYGRCWACIHGAQVLDAMAPISYSVAGEQLHQALAFYKRLSGAMARRLRAELAAVLWRFLTAHESCLSRAAGTCRFEVVTTVPSGDPNRDRNHPLRRIAGQLVGPTRHRYRRLLERSELEVEPRTFDESKYAPLEALRGETVLLIDDTWTTGANAQSAAAALRAAGAGAVAAVVLGRHVTRGWDENDRRLRALPDFDWTKCALCSNSRGLSASLADRRTDTASPRLPVAEEDRLRFERLKRVQ
jgi:predicted amidophosphoribosyltransferase